ncbi:MAG: N-acetylmuramoyl-L-alanine amidase [Actinobacteria bacterium]|nr:N-acetylmuramoyl-L-alanine amidase [Actinomycetota bacterium]
MRTLKFGDRGKEVLDVQSRLSSLGYDVGTDGVDGLFGADTRSAVKRFQQNSGLLVDGIVGENTWLELVEARYEPGERLLYLKIPPFRGADVLTLQRSLNRLGFNAGPEDGIFGDMTERAVLDFQKNSGLIMDGMVDDSVLRVMARVTKDGDPHSGGAKIPDRNGGYATGRSLSEMIVVIDPGHGGSDRGAISANGLCEKDLNLRVAVLLGEALAEAGSEVYFTRDADNFTGLYERSDLANQKNADLFISIHHNNESGSRAQGAAAYFFCRQGYYSERGKMLAEHIVDSVAGKLGVRAIPALGRNFAVLRETAMTAILVEPVFLSDSEMTELAGSETFARREAGAIFSGLKEYFNGG